jgi:hypothetical protein
MSGTELCNLARSDLSRKMKRASHRLHTGLQFGRGEVRLLTLTSSPQSRRGIRYDVKRLMAWLRRRGVGIQYFGVVETNAGSGLQHMHLLFRGPYLHQWCLSNTWRHFHQAYIVDIRKTYGSKRGIGSYLTKYLLKANGERVNPSFAHAYGIYLEVPGFPDSLRNLWTCSRDWGFRHMSLVWRAAVGLFSRTLRRVPYQVLYGLWWLFLQGEATPAQFLQWCCEVNGLGPQPPYFAIAASIKGNRGYFTSRNILGYEAGQ